MLIGYPDAINVVSSETVVHQPRSAFALFTLIVTLLISSLPVCAADWDTKSDTWTATDALGRKLPGYTECGPARDGKYVGIFYFLWLGQHGTSGPYDITKLLAANPTNPAYGGVGAFHHWGESELGYYLSNDTYVMRKHCQMLVDAGVDTLIFDVTNGFPYTTNYMLLLSVYQDIRDHGGATPQVCFLVNPDNNALVQTLYNDLYSKNLYPTLWFQWLGKPLILTKPDGLSSTLQNFFTFRRTWAWNAGTQDNWTWLDNYPQVTGWHTPGVPEEISVSAAGHPTTNRGRSFHLNSEPPVDKYALTPTAGQGLTFDEQWQRALQVDPQFVFITGWNEWVAQRFVSGGGDWFLGTQLPAGGTYFVDTYSQEFSRDIEPMKGGHGDNYYYQMISNIRRFKGVRRPEQPSTPKPISIDGSFSDWADVAPEFLDTMQDTIARNSAGWGSAGTYKNSTGRNDIAKLKVTYDVDNIYFYAETVSNLTSTTGSNWMLLFIDSDCNPATGWQGYDYLVNYPVTNATSTTLKANTGGWNWASAGSVAYRKSANKIEISIPRSAIGQSGTPDVTLDFHWADNIQKTNDITEFAVSGDSAPNRRANYHYGKIGPWPSWEFNTDGVLPSGSSSHSLANVTVANGCLSGTVNGDNPYIAEPRLPVINADANRYIQVRMKNSTGTTGEIFWGTEAKPYYEAGREIAFPITSDKTFHDYIIDMSVNPQWAGLVNTVRLDPCEASSGTVDIDFIRVMQDLDSGTISGTIVDPNAVGIPAATISTNVGGYTAATAADGSFAIPNATSGIYNLTVSKLGYVSQVLRNVAVAPSQTTTADAALDKIRDAGSAANARQLIDGTTIALFDKALYLKQGGFGYIEEQNRSSGLRIQGVIPTGAPSLVSLVGSLATTSGGERYIQLSEIESSGLASVKPVGVSVLARSLEGLYIKTWGTVKPGSITGNSFVIADGLDDLGIKVITPGTPTVTSGAFTIVAGAAGYDNGRLVISE